MKQSHGILLLVTCAVVWGLAFVAQSVSSGHIGPWTFNTIRFFLGFLTLLPLCWKEIANKRVWIGGVCCGVVLCLASYLQQKGIETTVTGKAGFITSLYLIIVPFLSIATGKNVTTKNWLCVVLALAGMYLLTGMEGGGLTKGELLILLSAFCFAAHIMVIDHFKEVPGIGLSAVQFLVASVIGVFFLPKEAPRWEAIHSVLVPLLYAGIMSCAVAYTLQIIGQKYVEPANAVLPLSLESVFSAIFGFLILGQRLSVHEIAGCAVVFSAVLLSQIDIRRQRNT
jgi:drug/metabolite transporter (DMT)-like permease